MKVRDIMRRDPITICDGDPLCVAQRCMAQYRIRHLPVVSDGHLTGMLSERDVLSARAHYEGDDEWWRMPVRGAMQIEPQTADPDDSVTEIAARMASTKLDAFPVVSRGHLIGVVTVIDVLDAEVREAMTPADQAIGELGAQPPSVRADQPLLEAVTVMFDQHVRDLPVLDQDDHLVGMLSESDVRRAIGDPAEYVESERARRYEVQDVMDPVVSKVEDDRTLAELAHRFADPRRDAVAVVDHAGTLVGLVSYIEALHALCG